MKRLRETPTCGLCSASEATTLCMCLDPPVLLCDMCIGLHDTKKKPKSHELLPIETVQYTKNPGYKDSIRRRRTAQKDAVPKLKSNVKTITRWRQEMIAIADHMLARINIFRSNVESEMTNLMHEVEADIEAGVKEFTEKFYEPEPQLQSPIAKALLAYKFGDFELFTCGTDFAAVKKSFNEFLFSVDALLQVELPGYEPRGIIKLPSDLKTDKKVSIYQKFTADFSTNQSRVALAKFKDFPVAIDIPRTLKRGPIQIGSDVYAGEWSQHHLPHGFGTFHRSNGDLYTGQWRDGHKQGLGRSIFADGKVHEGDYARDEFAGYGKCFWPDGSCYIGEFANNHKHGSGLFVYAARPDHLQFYIGQFADDQMSGRGAQFTRDAPAYAGFFKQGNRHGKGMMYEGGELLFQELK